MTATVTLPRGILHRYRRFSRFNSPYPEHDDARAIDLYPGDGRGISPVAGTVLETHTVGCPNRPYAADTDHVIVIDLAADYCATVGAEPGTTARVLHVVPAVEPGDRVGVGDDLGPTTRSGFFGRWVADHVHLGFRPPGQNPLRASGSLPVDIDVDVEPVAWSGRGTVVERGPAHVVLDTPRRPHETADRFAALASDEGIPLDGGLTHYAAGGTFPRAGAKAVEDGGVTQGDDAGGITLLGTRVGRRQGRGIDWDPVAVCANGERIVGLSLFASRRERIGVKLVCPDAAFGVGEAVTVTIRPIEDPIRLGVGR
ncbi:hypothetical protein [Halorubrum vacuolatum]|uniref:Peptidase family M23 n=1 Tax=Halorubrum vacuolatum TaxID=63740 RepID=A0A238UVR1_HALVU|nr:hypothetical protein [Halorubrum vacuolatum]SNR25309.1 hypothetical protein SAMN06264855_101351 [Halorubrum vacuolatum]